MLFLSLSHQKKKKKKSITCGIEDFKCSTNNVIFSHDNQIQPCDILAHIYIYIYIYSPSIQISINNRTKEANGCASSARDFMTTLESTCKIP